MADEHATPRDEIEIASEMIEAGVREFNANFPADCFLSETLTAVYRAMSAAAFKTGERDVGHASSSAIEPTLRT